MKRIHYLLIAFATLAAAIGFAVAGFIQLRGTPTTTEITEYGMIPFYVSSFGYGTAVNDEKDKTGDSMEMRYVEYRSQDGRFVFLREVSAEEYSDFEIARENEAEHRAVYRYVYTYMMDGKLETVIQEQELTDNQIREIVGETAHATIIQYFAFAGLLLIAGVYFLVSGIRKQDRPKRGQKPVEKEA